MKKTGMLLLLAIAIAATTYAQDKKKQKPDYTATAPADSLMPFQKYPTLPAFHILSMDSATVFNTYNIPTGKPTLLMFFSPTCEHCQHLAEAYERGQDSISNIQIYMVTFGHLPEVNWFYNKYHIGMNKNVVMLGRDYEGFEFNFYGMRFVPFLALYDKNKKLIKGTDHVMNVKELYELTH